MGTEETWRGVDRILDASLDDLALGVDARGRAAPQVADWRLPEDGRVILGSYGLPAPRDDDYLGVVGDLQESTEPHEGVDGRSWYVLGSYDRSRLAAVEWTGQVVAVPAGSQVHPDLAHLHPSGMSLTPVNSTLGAFVECAWRWHRLLPLLADEQERAGEAEVSALKAGQPVQDMVDPYAGYQELCRYVLSRFRKIDPELEADSGFWPDIIIDVW
ncbi:SUKH-4 family immunity protein [Micromonospora sp. NPDC048935]|uniref:SUKH-4 family immunity protein n=1 Tax=Micromonospora sp. NPDC048935 TaxID=3364262 RepID=UPI0037211EAD